MDSREDPTPKVTSVRIGFEAREREKVGVSRPVTSDEAIPRPDTPDPRLVHDPVGIAQPGVVSGKPTVRVPIA